MSVRWENPFVPPPEERDAIRRLRGRLPAGVTVLTAEEAGHRAGLTVSSLLVAEGEPGRVLALVGELTDFWEVASQSGRFVVHVLAADSQDRADRFAAIKPAPGGPFSGEELEPTEWGPRFRDVGDWAGCRLESARPVGYHLLVVATIERIEVAESTDPLVWYRGHYRRLARP
ncbi:MAG: oxidoreductase [Acidimicrobiia bacterium]|nr:MAG: oxidoreductase [Acidimicrobiia bacterium]